jgi:hypothetical protein
MIIPAWAMAKKTIGLTALGRRRRQQDDHPGVGDGQEDDRFDVAEEIDPEDEELDEPNDSQTQAEKQSTTTTPCSIFQRCSTLQLATQNSVRELTASKKCKSLEVTIPLSLIIIYLRWARRFPLHFHEDSVHCLSVISNIVGLTPIQVLEAYRLRYEPTAKHLHVNVNPGHLQIPCYRWMPMILENEN